MADNTTLNPGSLGDTIRNKDRGSAKTSVSLLDAGGLAGPEAIVGDTGVQLPIKGSGTAGTAATGVVTVQGIASMTPVQTSPIPGQVGVTGGVGVVAANTLRVNLGTDDLAVTSLAVMDDWDESDRAKVNPIVGVAGVAAGAGAVSTTVQRMTLASDDPAVTALQILDNTVSGSEMQVDVVAALPAGDNNIGNVDVVTMPTVTIQDGGGSITVDGTLSLSGSVDTELPAAAALADNTANPTVPGVGAFAMLWDSVTWDRAPGTTADGALVNLGANNDVTVTSGAITETNSAAIKTAVEILDNAISGSEMQVDVVAALPTGANVIGAVTQSGTWNVGTVTTVTTVSTVSSVSAVIPGTGATNLGKAIDTATGAIDTGVLILATRDDALSALTPIEGDNVQLRTDANGALWVIPSGTITVASHAVTNAGTFAVQVTSIAAGDNNIGNVDIVTVPTDPFGANADAASATGSISAKLRFIAATGIPITGTVTVGSHAVTNAGTFAVQDATAQASLSVMDDWDNAASDGASVSGDVAHDSVDAGEPVKLGMKAIAHGANPTAVAENDRTNWFANRAGVPWVIGGHPNVITRTVLIADADGAQTDVSIAGAIGAGTKVVVTSLMVTADNDNTDDIRVKVGFGASTLPADSATGASGILCDHPGVPAGGGFTRGDGSGILGVGGDGEEVRLTCGDPVGGSVTITFSYYTIES